MKHNMKIIFALFIALLFCVAISGGCGGGSSSSSSDDTATEEVTTPTDNPQGEKTILESPDEYVTPESGDEYGGNDWEVVSRFNLLDNTEWEITYICGRDHFKEIRGDLMENFIGKHVILRVMGNWLFWDDPNANNGRVNYFADPLTITYKTDFDEVYSAPVIRPGEFTQSTASYKFIAYHDGGVYDYDEFEVYSNKKKGNPDILEFKNSHYSPQGLHRRIDVQLTFVK